MAEIELSVFSNQCLNRRISDEVVLKREVSALEHERNQAAAVIDWRFSTQDARTKLQHTYPSYSDGNGTSGSNLGNPTFKLPSMALEFEIKYKTSGFRYYTRVSNAVLRPSTDSKLSLVNSCLALLVQEKRDREHAEQLRQEEAAKQAELLAQREAELKAEEQAKREAEKQARVAKLELQIILENKITVANTELIKTQTLAAQLEHEKTIGNLLNEIVRIRLVGEEDRARLTNEYFVELESSTSAFEGETEEIEARIQEYIDFNEKLFTSIAEYQASIESRVDDVRASVDEQLQQIEQLQQEAKDLEKEIEEIDQIEDTGVTEVSGVDDSS